MRLEDLRGLTGLPIEPVRHQLRHEDVVTVLPVRGESGRRDWLLVATPAKLAVLTGDTGPASGHWMTYWAPWDAVRISDEPEMAPDDDLYRLAVHVGGLTFHAALGGLAGQRALRDFVVAVWARHEALALSS